MVTSSFGKSSKKSTKMKATIVAALAIVCVLGVATLSHGAGFYYPQEQSSGGLFSSILPLLLLLIIFPFLFGSDTQGNTNIIFGNYSGPTGGK